jgi:hypothetical protein
MVAAATMRIATMVVRLEVDILEMRRRLAATSGGLATTTTTPMMPNSSPIATGTSTPTPIQTRLATIPSQTTIPMTTMYASPDLTSKPSRNTSLKKARVETTMVGTRPSAP